MVALPCYAQLLLEIIRQSQALYQCFAPET
jgi:hypothetical protein